MTHKKIANSLCIKSLVFALPFSLSIHAFAELVAVPDTGAVRVKQTDVAMPRSSAKKSHVQEQFGEPLSKSGPVGEPAIYTWRYNQFTVYFENDRVIHTVATSG